MPPKKAAAAPKKAAAPPPPPAPAKKAPAPSKKNAKVQEEEDDPIIETKPSVEESKPAKKVEKKTTEEKSQPVAAKADKKGTSSQKKEEPILPPLVVEAPVKPEPEPQFKLLKGDKYPIKYLMWEYLRVNKFTQGNEWSEVIDNQEFYLTIQETFPLLVLTDNHYFMGAVLTKDLWQRLKSKYFSQKDSNKFCDLKNVRLKIKKFQLHMRQVNSKDVFTSFGSLEVRLVIHDCDIMLSEMNQKRSYTNSVFKDEEVRTLLLNTFHSIMKNYLGNQAETVPKIISKKVKESEYKISFDQPESFGIVADPDPSGPLKYQVFECTQQNTSADFIMEMPAIIIDEKGDSYYNSLVEQRRKLESERRQREMAEAKGNRTRTPPKYQQYTRFNVNNKQQYLQQNAKKSAKSQLQIAAEESKDIDNNLKNLKQYTLKKLKASASKSQKNPPADIEPLSAELYKRFLAWFKQNMIEGLEKNENESPPKRASDNIQRDTKDFFKPDHDFSICLLTKRKLDFNISTALMPQKKQVIDVEMTSKAEEDIKQTVQQQQPSQDTNIPVRDEASPKKKAAANKEESKVLPAKKGSNKKATPPPAEIAEPPKKTPAVAQPEQPKNKRNEKVETKKKAQEDAQAEDTTSEEQQQLTKKVAAPPAASKAKTAPPAPQKKVEVVAAGKKRTAVPVAPVVQNKLASSIKKQKTS